MRPGDNDFVVVERVDVVEYLTAIRMQHPDLWKSIVGKRVDHLKTKYAGVAGVAIIACNVLTFLLS